MWVVLSVQTMVLGSFAERCGLCDLDPVAERCSLDVAHLLGGCIVGDVGSWLARGCGLVVVLCVAFGLAACLVVVLSHDVRVTRLLSAESLS